MKAVNVHLTDETHQKLSRLKIAWGESNLADVITSIIETCYTDLNAPATGSLKSSAEMI